MRHDDDDDGSLTLIEVYVDGLAEPVNPGTGTYGFVVYKDGEKIDQGHGPAGDEVTNNYAEYFALIRALTSIIQHAKEPVLVKSDSKLLVNQMIGRWKVRKGGYVEKYREAKELANRFNSIEFLWIPREKNAEADELSRIAYAELRRARFRRIS